MIRPDFSREYVDIKGHSKFLNEIPVQSFGSYNRAILMYQILSKDIVKELEQLIYHNPEQFDNDVVDSLGLDRTMPGNRHQVTYDINLLGDLLIINRYYIGSINKI